MIQWVVLFSGTLVGMVFSSYLVGYRVGHNRSWLPAVYPPAKPPTRAVLRLQRRIIREAIVVPKSELTQ